MTSGMDEDKINWETGRMVKKKDRGVPIYCAKKKPKQGPILAIMILNMIVFIGLPFLVMWGLVSLWSVAMGG